MPLIKEVHRYYRYGNTRHHKYSPDRRRPHALAPTMNTPLKLLVLLGVGAALAQFVPNILCMLIQGGTIIAMGLVVWWIWKVLTRR